MSNVESKISSPAFAGKTRLGLDRVDIDDPAGPGAQEHLEGLSVAASDIGVGAAIALDGPDTVETMLAHYGSAFAATDPVPADAIGPIGLRIPVPAELEAEIIAAMAIAPVLFRIKLPVGLCVPARLVGLLNLALVFFIHLDSALFGITLVF